MIGYVDWSFWWLLGAGLAMGWVARGVVEVERRVQRRMDRARDRHPSRYPAHRAEMDVYADEWMTGGR